MKKTMFILVVLVLASAVSVLAQGPFTDVPTDHWAYDAVNTLQKDGILIGYPDGTFGGKRTITRYEFAVAIARVLGVNNPVMSSGLTKADVEGMLNGYAKKSELPAIPQNLATKDDVAALRKLIDEFRDELAALGVDVDALKRDVAALSARVEAIEAELKRVRFTGDATIFAIAENSVNGTTVNLDERQSSKALGNDAFMTNIALVKDFDLNIVGRVTNNTTANATINYGDYLNYLAFVDDYVGGAIPTSATPPATAGGTLADTFFPYYLNIQSGLGFGDLTAGRFPLQFTPYTLKKIDVDSYTNILKTEDGNYPVDGAKLGVNLGYVDLTLFAAKNNENLFLINGLTGQPAAGVYDNLPATGLPLSKLCIMQQLPGQVVGHAVGGLTQVTQSAGVRAVAGIPWNGTIAGTYYQAWDGNAYTAGLPYDQARVLGADLSIPIPVLSGINFFGSWTESTTLTGAKATAASSDVDYLNTAWDGKFSAALGRFGVGLGYKDIGRNFSAAGFWDKIGRWTNPTNVKGPYGDLQVPIMSNLRFAANGEWLEVKDNFGPVPSATTWGNDGDKLAMAQGAFKWGFTKVNTLDVSYQWIKFNPDTAGLAEATETYLTVGLTHQFCPNTGVKVGYQFISYNDGDTGSGPYRSPVVAPNNDYRGGLGVVQFGVTF